MMQRSRVVFIRRLYLAIWRSLHGWFVRTRGESGAETYTAGAMGAATFFQLLAILWIAQIARVLDIGLLLSDKAIVLALLAIPCMAAHFYLARYVNKLDKDQMPHGTRFETPSPALGLGYLAGSALFYFLLVIIAFRLRWGCASRMGGV